MLLGATLASPAWPLDPASSINRYLLEEWDARDGLVSDSVLALAQTPNGYLWIGTAKGLVRFDGLRLTEVPDVGPPVSALAIDRAGGLWIASGGRLIRRHAGTSHEYPVSGEAAALLGDLRGGLWVGTGEDAGRVTPPRHADPHDLRRQQR
jgi:ligand-binding sensor domain-containing protein